MSPESQDDESQDDESLRERFYGSRFDSVNTAIEAVKDIVNERDRLYDSRFLAAAAALATQEKTVSFAFAAAEKAMLKAEQIQKECNERSNELFKTLEDKIDGLRDSIDTGQHNYVEQKNWSTGMVITITVAIVGSIATIVGAFLFTTMGK